MLDIIFAFFHGALLSIGLIIPLGIQNTFIFYQGAVQETYSKALPTIITAGICDTILIILAIQGVSMILLQMAWLKLTFFVIGFCFVTYMGFISWRTGNSEYDKKFQAYSFRKQIIFSASVSVFNPHVIIDTVAVIGTNSIEYFGVIRHAFALGCVLVAWGWFFTLAYAGRKLHQQNNKKLIILVNKIAAIIMWIVATYLVVQIIQEFY